MPEYSPDYDTLYDLNATAPDSIVIWAGILESDSAGQPIMNTAKYLRSLNTFLQYATTVMPKFGMRAIVECPLAALNNPRVKHVQVAAVPYASHPGAASPAETSMGEAIYGGMHAMLYKLNGQEETGEKPATTIDCSILKTPTPYDRTKITQKPQERAQALVDKPFYLFPDRADWRKGSAVFFYGLRNPKVSSADLFLVQVQKCMAHIQDNKQKDQDAAIFVAGRDYVLYFEHFRYKTELRSTKNTDLLASLAEKLVLGEAIDVQAPASIEAKAMSYKLDDASVTRHMFNVPERSELPELI